MKPNLASASQEEQLLLLRDMTARMGVLHEAQILQLKMWPLVLFDNIKKCEEHVNIEGKVLEFHILQTKGKYPADKDKRFDVLIDWSKWLLGHDWLVRIKERGKLIFRRGPEINA
jgi:hypothetical protein